MNKQKIANLVTSKEIQIKTRYFSPNKLAIVKNLKDEYPVMEMTHEMDFYCRWDVILSNNFLAFKT